MSDIQVNAQKEKNFYTAPASTRKVCDEMKQRKNYTSVKVLLMEVSTL